MKRQWRQALAFVLAVCICLAGFTGTVQAAKKSVDEKLDEKVTSILDKNTDEEDTGKEKLKKLFTYVEDEYGYERKVGFEDYAGWEKDYAYEMLRKKKGSCYHFAAAYAYLAAKATDYKVRIGVGQTNGFSGELQPHAWVEIKIKSTWYICDPNMDKFAEDSSGKYYLKKRSKLKKVYNSYKDAKYVTVIGMKPEGLRQIGGKEYLFDEKGIQRTGWQQYRGNYYFFKIADGAKGYMVKSDRVNGITLQKDGRAKLTSESKEKLKVLVLATEIVEKATEPGMTKSEKLKKTFDYLKANYRYRGSPKFMHTKHWEQDYALSMFEDGHGSCYAYGASFAFLANAVGCKGCYAISSGGHGWAEVDGKIYDPSWSIVDKKHNYYGMDYSMSGRGGVPGYKNSKVYVVKI